jgi:hypothetical protein
VRTPDDVPERVEPLLVFVRVYVDPDELDFFLVVYD